MQTRIIKISFILFIFASGYAFSQSPAQRFPRPQFDSGYQQPTTTTPSARAAALDFLDVFILIVALALASYFSIKKRSRLALFALMIFSLLYFGFWRKGCICPVGSLQNIFLGLIDSSYIIPWSVVLFFALPLVFSLFYGRAFCAAVCPLGAIQDLFALKSMQVPAWLERALRLLPYTYLGLVVLFVATKSAFLICRFDPFIGFFRLNANFNMTLFGLLFLGLAVFIARPYCRFLCPYGVLLSWMSRFSRRNVSITPKECVQCRLCERACPFGAINTPVSVSANETREKNVRRLGFLLLLLPVMLVAGSRLGTLLHIPLSRIHPTVQLAETLRLQDAGLFQGETLETKAFRSSGKPTEQLYKEALTIQINFKTGSLVLGAFLMLILNLKLINLSIHRRQDDYQADRSRCLSCGRCFVYCPIEIERRQKVSTTAGPQKPWDWL